MEKLNRLSDNQFENGKSYFFNVLELKKNDEGVDLLYVEYNGEKYTVVPTKSQGEKELPKKFRNIFPSQH